MTISLIFKTCAIVKKNGYMKGKKYGNAYNRVAYIMVTHTHTHNKRILVQRKELYNNRMHP